MASGGPPSGDRGPKDVLLRALDLKEQWPATLPARLHLALESPLGNFLALCFLQEHTLCLFTLTICLSDS